MHYRKLPVLLFLLALAALLATPGAALAGTRNHSYSVDPGYADYYPLQKARNWSAKAEFTSGKYVLRSVGDTTIGDGKWLGYRAAYLRTADTKLYERGSGPAFRVTPAEFNSRANGKYMCSVSYQKVTHRWEYWGVLYYITTRVGKTTVSTPVYGWKHTSRAYPVAKSMVLILK